MHVRVQRSGDAGPGAPVGPRDLPALEHLAGRLAMAEERRRALETCVGDAVVLLDRLEVRDLNEAAAELLGVAAEAARGRSILALVAPASRHGVAALLEAPLDRGPPVRLVRHDGRAAWLAPHRTLLSAGLELLVLRDVTAATETEEDLRATRARLAAACGEGGFVAGLDEDGRITDWDAAAADATGRSHAEMFWTPFGRLLSASSARIAEQMMQEARRAGRSVRWARVRAAHGEVGADLSLHRTETGFDLVVRAERAQPRAATGALATERDLHAAVHDIQAPLSTLQGFCGLLAEEELGEAARRHLEVVGAAADRIGLLVGAFLDYARTGAAGRVPLDMAAVVADAMAALRAEAEAAEAELDSAGLPRVLGDPVALGQLVQNLLGNALKFKADRPPRIQVRATRDGAFWRFTVTDNGHGLPPEAAEDAFTLFRRFHDGVPGTGAGLAICRRIVEAHGGRIGLEGRPGEGTTAWFTLPAEPAAAGPAEASVTMEAALRSEDPPGGGAAASRAAVAGKSL